MLLLYFYTSEALSREGVVVLEIIKTSSRRRDLPRSSQICRKCRAGFFVGFFLFVLSAEVKILNSVICWLQPHITGWMWLLTGSGMDSALPEGETVTESRLSVRQPAERDETKVRGVCSPKLCFQFSF